MYPILFHSGNFIIPSYFAVISVVCSLAMIWTAFRADRNNFPRNMALDLALVIMIFGFIGARAFHVVFEYPALYFGSPWRIFRFWEGGFVYYGGAILAFIAGIIFLKLKRETISPWLDLIAPILSLSYALARVGCFLAGCCFGRYCQLPWAVTFPLGGEAPAGISIHPTQLYATFWELAVCGLLLLIESRKSKTWLSKPGDLFFIWIMFHGIGRIVMELFRADYRGDRVFGLSVSTAISMGVIAVGMFFYLKRKPKNKSSAR